MIDLDELEALTKKATNGPWAVDSDGSVSTADGESLICDPPFYVRTKCAKRDGAFIARTRTAVPELTIELRRIQSLAAKWREQSRDAAANGSDARSRALAECADALEGK